jgi:hypothetical protein
MKQIWFTQLILFFSKRPYGDQFLTYNIHNLQHIVEECKRFGSLEIYSCCFTFENLIGKLKQTWFANKTFATANQSINRNPT